MKKAAFVLAVVISLCALAGCGTLADSLASHAVDNAVDTEADNAVARAVDFGTDEVLCALGDGSLIDSQYALAKIVTPATEKTRNQAEVIFVGDGTKGWTKWVVPSRKADKADFQIGAVLLAPLGWSVGYGLSSEEYRKSNWGLGRVTNTDDVFKGLVEIAGGMYETKYVRVSLKKIED